MDLLDQFHLDGSTIIMVTHDRSLAERADRSVVMRDGRIIEGGHVA